MGDFSDFNPSVVFSDVVLFFGGVDKTTTGP
jgi:hypothetical protein